VRARARAIVAGATAFVAAALLGCAAHHPSGGAAPAAAPARSYATTLLARRCGSCHAVPNPAAMPEERWVAALERMKIRMQLPAADWDSLAAMAVVHAADTASVGR
jgi:hypothetical protein